MTVGASTSSIVLGSRSRPSQWRPASRSELGALSIYFFLVIAVTDVANFRLGVEVMTLVVLLPALFITQMPSLFLRDWWFLLIGLILWNLSGPIAAESPAPPHLDFMLNFDRFLFAGRDPVTVVQQHLAASAHVQLLDWITSAVYNLHVPEPYIAGYLLWRLNRAVYLQFAAAALLLLVIGFVTFIVFPAIPPWMASSWYGRLPGVENRFKITLAAHPLPFHGSPLFYLFHFKGDAVAAFPSEHAAFPMLELIAFTLAFGRRLAIVFTGYVLAVLFTIVYLGEHWITDALAGYLYALAIFSFVVWFCNRGQMSWHNAGQGAPIGVSGRPVR